MEVNKQGETVNTKNLEEGINMEHSWILIMAMIGHILCVYADRLLLCTPGGQFSFSDMKDNARMADRLLCGNSPVLGRAFHTGGDRNNVASRIDLLYGASLGVRGVSSFPSI